MRLWTIHPKHLDQKGLTAAWREGLMAQSVLRKLQAGEKPGYRNHSQLERFKASPVSMCLIGTWLTFLQEEATRRGYNFNYDKIIKPGKLFKLIATSGQLEFEREHLLHKLETRSTADYEQLVSIKAQPHPMFELVNGDVEKWEKAQ